MLDFLFTAKGDTKAVERFLHQILQRDHVQQAPRVINTDKSVVYPGAIEALQATGELPEEVEHRSVKYLNNILEPDHRFLK